MKALQVSMLPQPTATTCGATCLESVYRYYGKEEGIGAIQHDLMFTTDHGVFDASLGIHALMRGFKASITTMNIVVFDPTWSFKDANEIKRHLQLGKRGRDQFLGMACEAHNKFLDLGGKLEFRDITLDSIGRPIDAGHPVVLSLCSTFLYNCPRPLEKNHDIYSRVRGHFVVAIGVDERRQMVRIRDPYNGFENELGANYEVSWSHLVCAIGLGVLTLDCSMLVIKPG